MFRRKKLKSVRDDDHADDNELLATTTEAVSQLPVSHEPISHEPVTTLPNAVTKELAGRYASLLVICYRRRDISGMHIALAAFTHTLHALGEWKNKHDIMQETKKYSLLEGFPAAEQQALEWLLNHYFEQPNIGDESVLLHWYQSLDDEWVLRKKLREMFPDKASSELTQLIAIEQEQNKQGKDSG